MSKHRFPRKGRNRAHLLFLVAFVALLLPERVIADGPPDDQLVRGFSVQFGISAGSSLVAPVLTSAFGTLVSAKYQFDSSNALRVGLSGSYTETTYTYIDQSQNGTTAGTISASVGYLRYLDPQAPVKVYWGVGASAGVSVTGCAGPGLHASVPVERGGADVSGRGVVLHEPAEPLGRVWSFVRLLGRIAQGQRDRDLPERRELCTGLGQRPESLRTSGDSMPWSDSASNERRFHDSVLRWFGAAGVYTFVGAGGKSTAMKRIARLLAETGARIWLTTTTRIGIEEFSAFPLSILRDGDDLPKVPASAQIALLAGDVDEKAGKLLGVDPGLVGSLSARDEAFILVEGDGSRRLPVKAPRAWERVIPPASAAVLCLMGASAFDEPVDAVRCYNHEGAFAILGGTERRFGAEEIATLAAHPEGGRKGVAVGMGFRLLLNQCDLARKRDTALAALRIARDRWGIQGALLSFERGELYEAD